MTPTSFRFSVAVAELPFRLCTEGWPPELQQEIMNNDALQDKTCLYLLFQVIWPPSFSAWAVLWHPLAHSIWSNMIITFLIFTFYLVNVCVKFENSSSSKCRKNGSVTLRQLMCSENYLYHSSPFSASHPNFKFWRLQGNATSLYIRVVINSIALQLIECYRLLASQC